MKKEVEGASVELGQAVDRGGEVFIWRGKGVHIEVLGCEREGGRRGKK